MQYCLANLILNSSNQMCTKMYGWDQILLLAFAKFEINEKYLNNQTIFPQMASSET